MTTREVIQRVGSALDRRWRGVDSEDERFPELAGEAVAEILSATRLDLEAVGGMVLDPGSLPAQLDPRAEFSDLPVTLFRAERFVIDALVWMDMDTSIHDHTFSGAFGIAQGSSIHAGYDFTGECLGHVALGKLTLQRGEILRAGAVRAIHAGPRFIHSTFHMDRPTISLVCRTVRDHRVGAPRKYLRPGIAFDSSDATERLDRTLRYISLLARTEPAAYVEAAGKVLRDCDSLTAFRLLWQAWEDGRATGFFEGVFAAGRETRHAPLTAAVEQASRYSHLEYTVARWRRVATTDELRFFVGLLLALTTREAIVNVTREWGRDAPADKLVEWTGKLAAAAGGDVLGITERRLAVLHGALRGIDAEESAAELTDVFVTPSAVTRGEIEAERAYLRAHPLLWPMLVDREGR